MYQTLFLCLPVGRELFFNQTSWVDVTIQGVATTSPVTASSTTAQTTSPESKGAFDTHTSYKEDHVSADDSENEAPTEPPSMFSTSMAPPSVTMAPSSSESQTNSPAVTMVFKEDDSVVTLPDEFGSKITDESDVRGDVVHMESTAGPNVTETPPEESEDQSVIRVNMIPPDVPLSTSQSTESLFAIGKTEESIMEKISADSVSGLEETHVTPDMSSVLEPTATINVSPDSDTEETAEATQPTMEIKASTTSTEASSASEPPTKHSYHSSSQTPVHLLSRTPQESRATILTDEAGFPGTPDVYLTTVAPTDETTAFADYDEGGKSTDLGVMAGPPSLQTITAEADVSDTSDGGDSSGLDTTAVTTEATVTFTTVVCDTVPGTETETTTPKMEEVKQDFSPVEESSSIGPVTKSADLIDTQKPISTVPPSDESTVFTMMRLKTDASRETLPEESSTSAAVEKQSVSETQDALSEPTPKSSDTTTDTDAKQVPPVTISPATSPANCTVSSDALSVHVIIINVDEKAKNDTGKAHFNHFDY